jgi:hypothetical protein
VDQLVELVNTNPQLAVGLPVVVILLTTALVQTVKVLFHKEK